VRHLVETVTLLLAGLGAGACTSFGKDELPKEAPPLADMEEPVALLEEPADEPRRRELPLGSFTGVTVGETRRSLDDEAPAAPGVRVVRVVENSPADAAGVEEDDLLLAARTGGAERALRWPSEWRKLEQDTAPGAAIEVDLDRAGAERTVTIRTTARVRPAERAAAERFRDERKVGVVLRTATEVEARAAGLGAGGGAVVVGLSAHSPWRAAGLRFGDVVVTVDGRPVGHPQEVLEAIRRAKAGDALALDVVRDGARLPVEARVSRRGDEVRRIRIPLVWTYERDRGEVETSLLLGALRTRSTAAAWEWRVLWLLTFRGGDADRLEEVR
jgi:C-terminal processing protease CtpA/Prc